MNFKNIYKETQKLDAMLQSVEDGLPVRENLNEATHLQEMAQATTRGILQYIIKSSNIDTNYSNDAIIQKLNQLMIEYGNGVGIDEEFSPTFDEKSVKSEGIKEVWVDTSQNKTFIKKKDNSTKEAMLFWLECFWRDLSNSKKYTPDQCNTIYKFVKDYCNKRKLVIQTN
ncbi:hypothetical protein AGMMS49944_20500 [Spirochaetia bacterium]|nr:hypothetical protein AGMMS49944_20500 [Spirochaetia bacterium]